MNDQRDKVTALGTTTEGANAYAAAQIERFLRAFEQHTDFLNTRHQLTDDQKLAHAAFDRLGAGLGVGGFIPPVTPLVRKNNTVEIQVPDQARRARIFAQSGVYDIDVQPGKQLALNDRLDPSDRIGRIEFYSATDTLLGVTGGQAPTDLDRSRSRY